jgi:tRNA A37 threonylcarbamoyladenosine synthetase subunit TsaC/SUA5/YrdC
MTAIYRNEPYEVIADITSLGVAVTGLVLALELLDENGSRVAGPSANATESPAGTYTATLTAAQTAGVEGTKVVRRLYAPAGGLDSRDKKPIPIIYRPLE